MSVRWRSSKAVGNNQALKALAYKVFRRLPVKKGLVVFESHLGKQYSDSPRYIYEAAVAAGLDRLGLDPVWSYAPAHRRVPHRRTAGASGELALPPRPGQGRVLGRQPGLPARVQPPPGDDLHPDLARDAAQADGLRLPGAGTGQRVGPAPAQGDDAALERAARAERVLRRDVREVLRVRRRAGAARPAAQRPAGPRGGRRLGRGEEARAGPAHRPAPRALLPDLPGPGPPARDSLRAAAGPRADAPRAGRRRAPDAAHPLPGHLQALRRGSRRSPPTCRGTTTSPS